MQLARRVHGTWMLGVKGVNAAPGVKYRLKRRKATRKTLRTGHSNVIPRQCGASSPESRDSPMCNCTSEAPEDACPGMTDPIVIAFATEARSVPAIGACRRTPQPPRRRADDPRGR